MSSARAAVLALCLLALVPAAFAANPVVLSIDPTSIVAGSPSFVLTVNGANFVSGSTIKFGTSTLQTTFVSSSKLTANVLSTQILNAGTVQVTATNPGTVASSPLNFTILPNNPQITSFDPAQLSLNTPVTVKVIGQNFASTATIRVNNVTHATTFVNDTQLTFVPTASEVSHIGNLNVQVLNPNSKLSNTATLPVVSATNPTITLLSPNTIAAGGPAFTLTVVGTNFVTNSAIRVNNAVRATTFVDSTHLTTQIAAFEISKAGSLLINVVNPNNASSAASTLTITNGTAPVIDSISPNSVIAGAQPFTLTITGSNFTTGSTVKVGNAVPRNATFVDSQHLTVGIVSGDVLNQGSVSITVTTPSPNGGTSNAVTLTVVSQFAPKLTSMTPSSVAAGSQTFKLLITGTGFKIDDIVLANGDAIPTEFISATQIAATIDASLVAISGNLLVSVKRKDNSGTSAPLTLTVTDVDAPAITNFAPPTGDVGGSPFTLAIIGRNFTQASVVTLDGAPRDTTFISTTELRIPITAADLATAHQFQIQVVNAGNVVSQTALYVISVPIPSIDTISPTSVISGQPGFQLKVTGSNFSSTSKINVNGSPRATEVQASTGALTTNLTEADIATPGTLSITVSDNGATSSAATLNVLQPTINAIDPTTLLLGSLSVTLRIDGTAFLPTSKVIFKGNEQPTTFNTDGSLTALISGTDLLDAGMFAVSVRNSPTSISLPVLIAVAGSGTPTISSTSQASVVVGATQLTINGTNFVPLSVVRINGTDRVSTFLGGTQLVVNLLPGDTAGPGSFTVQVRNPDGTLSNIVTVAVTGQAVVPPRRRGTRH